MKLRFAAGSHGHLDALRDGSVKPRTVQFDHVEVTSIAPAFVRMVRTLEYDLCEMTFGTYLCAKALGKDLVALPIFVLRGMHHGAMVRLADSSITGPEDLVGRRVGVGRGWTRTAGIWARAILAEEYGLDLQDVRWVLTGEEDVPGYVPPAIAARWPEESSMLHLLTRGDVVSATGIRSSTVSLTPVIPGADEAAFEALRTRGLYPINHLLVVRSDVLATRPDVAVDLFEAFAESKRRYVDSLVSDEDAPRAEHDRFYRRVMATTGSDPLPYGVAPNLPMIEALMHHAVVQGVIAARLDIEQLFAPGTLELVG